MENTVVILCDIGNTSYHFLEGDTHYKKSVELFDPETIKEKVYYICVNLHVQKKLKSLKNWIDLSLHIDMQNYYSTMGIDRIIACEAIQNGVIVDAGSAITVDVVIDGTFEGGFIYPGTKAMQRTYKDISPALAYEFNYDLDLNKLPKNSQDAISYGFLKTLHVEVLSHKKDIFLTGGDAHKLIKIFPQAKLEEILLFSGMKKIIEEKLYKRVN